MRSVVSSSITFPPLISITSNRTTSHDLFVTLRTLHAKYGTYTQIGLLMKVLEIRLGYDSPLRDTLAEVRSYCRRIIAMGKIKDDNIFTLTLLHPMSDHFTHLQQAVLNMTLLPDFNSEMGRQVYLGRRRADPLPPRTTRTASSNPTAHQALSHSNQSAFAALNSRQRGPKPIYSNCKRENHSTDYCISPGGKMAGRSVAEARAAFKAAAALQY
jgi:hypothetical protein